MFSEPFIPLLRYITISVPTLSVMVRWSLGRLIQQDVSVDLGYTTPVARQSIGHSATPYLDSPREKLKQDAPQQPCSHPPSLKHSTIDKKKKEVFGAKEMKKSAREFRIAWIVVKNSKGPFESCFEGLFTAQLTRVLHVETVHLVCPCVVVEIAYTQQGKKLKKLAKAYTRGTKGKIQLLSRTSALMQYQGLQTPGQIASPPSPAEQDTALVPVDSQSSNNYALDAVVNYNRLIIAIDFGETNSSVSWSLMPTDILSDTIVLAALERFKVQACAGPVVIDRR
ncbi:hypothetical protein FPANT_3488 [Fusarium pseudoanthophilum]|uniref:Uncharacterized protein n=1 Tax=Fusarium pseudoanthophilum TaxID=48495 RepID=A0A8H5UV62_9HYPO|nr:hypothetical protein FPANT_3488 [Fusarium pseudoanthophilum]